MHSYALVEKHEVTNGILMRLNGNIIKLLCIYTHLSCTFYSEKLEIVFTLGCRIFLNEFPHI